MVAGMVDSEMEGTLVIRNRRAADRFFTSGTLKNNLNSYYTIAVMLNIVFSTRHIPVS